MMYGRFRKHRQIAGGIATWTVLLLAAFYLYCYGTGLFADQAQDHSPAYFGNNVSYLDGTDPKDSQIWACDRSPDGWRERAEGYDRETGTHIFVRDPDGSGGSCGRKDTRYNMEWHRMWGGRDDNPGDKSIH